MIDFRHRLTIASDWLGRPIPPEDGSTVEVRASGSELLVEVEAPYVGDPPPPGPLSSTERLWEYEVVELFLVGGASAEDPERASYVEIELSPHGHYLVLTFEGIRRRTGSHRASAARAQILGDRWRGAISVDRALAPDPPLAANAYRLCGREPNRRFLAAHPVPGTAPDFHRIDRFPPLGRGGAM